MGNLGPWEIALIVLAVLLVFGPKQLPKIGRALGGSMREFKDSVTGPAQEIKEAMDAPLELRSFNPKQQLKDALNPFHEEDEEGEVLEGEIVDAAGDPAVEPATALEVAATDPAPADASAPTEPEHEPAEKA
jgi:sec-independent protein translocase protein TatA